MAEFDLHGQTLALHHFRRRFCKAYSRIDSVIIDNGEDMSVIAEFHTIGKFSFKGQSKRFSTLEYCIVNNCNHKRLYSLSLFDG